MTDTSVNLQVNNPIIASNVTVTESDTGYSKTGNGKTRYNFLPYNASPGSGGIETFETNALMLAADSLTVGKIVQSNEDLVGGQFLVFTKSALTVDNTNTFTGTNYDFRRESNQSSEIKPEYALTTGDGIADDSSNLASVIASATTFKRPIYLNSLDKVYNCNGATLDFAGNKLIGKGGVLKNCTIQNAVIEVDDLTQIFDTDVTIDKSCKVKHLTPQNFGTITNTDDSVFSNACHEAIQACLDKPFAVHFPGGYYYITQELVVSKPKTLTFANMHGERHAGSTNTNFPADATNPDHSVIYTDQDIYLVQIASRQIFWLGGTLECRNITNHTKYAIRFNLDYYMWGGRIECNIYGNPDSISNEGGGSGGILGDMATATKTGFIVGWTIKCFMRHLKNPVHFKDYGEGNTNTYGNFINTLTIDCDIDQCKTGYILDGCGGGYTVLDGTFQSRSILIGAEKDNAFISIKRERFVHLRDNAFWDIGTQNPSSPFKNSRAFELYKTFGEIFVSGLSLAHLDELINEDDLLTQQNAYIKDPKGVIFRSRGIAPDLIDSDKNNELMRLPESDISFSAYQGSGYDFDSNLTESIGQSAQGNITFANEERLVKIADGWTTAASAVIGSGTDLDNDFVEIVLDNTSLREGQLLLAFKSGSLYPKRVQVIFIYSDATPTLVKNIYPTNRANTYGKFDNPDDNLDKIIIRYIGFNEEGTLNFSDTCYVSSRNNINYIHKHNPNEQLLEGNFGAKSLKLDSGSSSRPFRIFNDVPDYSVPVKVNDFVKRNLSTGTMYRCNSQYTANETQDYTKWDVIQWQPYHKSGSDSPLGNEAPDNYQQKYYRSNKEIWEATGLTNADWVLLNKPTEVVASTDTQILASNTTPIDLISAPGSGKNIEVTRVKVKTTAGSADYATNTSLEIKYDGGDVIATIDLSALPASGGFKTYALNSVSIPADTKIIAETANANPETGTKSIEIYMDHNII